MYERPAAGVYVTATKVVKQGDPATASGFVGAAQKQQARSWSAGLTTPETIAIGEKFHIRTKGARQFDVGAGTKGAAIAAGTKGQGVYIRPADDTLRLEGATAAGDLPFGRIIELPADNRGVPSDKLRIDLDQKDTLAAT